MKKDKKGAACMKERCRRVWKTHNALCSWILTAALLFLAYAICATILHFTRIDNDAPVVFVLAVVVISPDHISYVLWNCGFHCQHLCHQLFFLPILIITLR